MTISCAFSSGVRPRAIPWWSGPARLPVWPCRGSSSTRSVWLHPPHPDARRAAGCLGHGRGTGDRPRPAARAGRCPALSDEDDHPVVTHRGVGPGAAGAAGPNGTGAQTGRLGRPAVAGGRHAFPDTPCVFLYRDPVEVIVSHLGHRGDHMVPGTLPEDIIGISTDEIRPTAEQYLAHRPPSSVRGRPRRCPPGTCASSTTPRSRTPFPTSCAVLRFSRRTGRPRHHGGRSPDTTPRTGSSPTHLMPPTNESSQRRHPGGRRHRGQADL